LFHVVEMLIALVKKNAMKLLNIDAHSESFQAGMM
jgi:hypothetical protein